MRDKIQYRPRLCGVVAYLGLEHLDPQRLLPGMVAGARHFALLPVVIAFYFFNRRSLISIAYGGLGVSSSTILPSAPNVTFAANVSPRLFAATLATPDDGGDARAEAIEEYILDRAYLWRCYEPGGSHE